jgi:DNA gyrase subunit A
MGRNTTGVWGIKLVGDDVLVGMVVADPDGFLLTVCEKGYGKRTPFGPNVADDAEDEAEEVESTPPPAAGGEGEGEEPVDRSAMRYRRQRRGGKGVRDIKTSDRNGKVVAVAAVRAGDEIMLISQQGMVTRSKVDDIRVVGRNTQGVRVMTPNEGDALATVAKVASETVGEGEGT